MTTSPLLPLTAADLPPLAPELVLIGSAFALMILDLFVSKQNKLITHLFSLAALAVVLVMLATGTAFGLMNGLIVVYGRLQPIIATLATGAIAIGLALLLRPQPGLRRLGLARSTPARCTPRSGRTTPATARTAA